MVVKIKHVCQKLHDFQHVFEVFSHCLLGFSVLDLDFLRGMNLRTRLRHLSLKVYLCALCGHLSSVPSSFSAFTYWSVSDIDIEIDVDSVYIGSDHVILNKLINERSQLQCNCSLY